MCPDFPNCCIQAYISVNLVLTHACNAITDPELLKMDKIFQDMTYPVAFCLPLYDD